MQNSSSVLVDEKQIVAPPKKNKKATKTRRWGTAYILSIVASAIVALTLTFVPTLSNLAVGALSMALAVLLLISGVHVGIAMLASGVLGLWQLSSSSAVTASLQEVPFYTVADWSLTVIPLFILMGVAMGRFNLTSRLFMVAERWLGWLPGGLAVSTNFAGAGLAATSGSTMAVAHALGRSTLPQMLRAGYHPSLATGVVAAAGTLGMLIPPSVMMIVYSGISETPVGPQLLAGVVPGIVTALAYAIMIAVRSALKPSLAPRSEQTYTWLERFRSLSNIVPIGLIMTIVVGGMYAGVFTPTEAAAFGALTALLVGWLYSPNRGLKSFTRSVFYTLRDTVVSTASIFLLLIGIHVLTRVIALSGVTDYLTEVIISWELSRVPFLLILIGVFIVLGMFLDGMAMLLLTVPILLPILELYDINLIWFGVFMVILVEMALITPPIGILGYIVHKIADDPKVNLGTNVSLTQVFSGIAWFVVINILLLILIIFIPEIVLWFPEMSNA